MSKAHLYINSNGYPITRHSYSASSDFNFCAKKYYLRRIAGWAERKQSAAMEFGKVLETAITNFHARDVAFAVLNFLEQWSKFRENTVLEYSAKDGNWDDLNLSGQEFIHLYALKYPNFAFTFSGDNAFQIQRNYEVFPGTDLAGIELVSYIDAIGRLKAGHFDPALNDDRVVLDMKVSGESCPELVSLDPQLRTYSWITKIPTNGFLWFKKCSRKLERGDEITILEKVGEVAAGTQAWVLSADINDIPITPPSIYVVADEKVLEEYAAIKGQKAADKEARLQFIRDRGIIVSISSVTRQQIEVRTAVISEASRADMQKQVEQDIVRIVHASETDFFPMQSGVRFPNNKCTLCACRGICSGNDKLRDELLVRTNEEVF